MDCRSGSRIVPENRSLGCQFRNAGLEPIDLQQCPRGIGRDKGQMACCRQERASRQALHPCAMSNHERSRWFGGQQRRSDSRTCVVCLRVVMEECCSLMVRRPRRSVRGRTGRVDNQAGTGGDDSKQENQCSADHGWRSSSRRGAMHQIRRVPTESYRERPMSERRQRVSSRMVSALNRSSESSCKSAMQ